VAADECSRAARIRKAFDLKKQTNKLEDIYRRVLSEAELKLPAGRVLAQKFDAAQYQREQRICGMKSVLIIEAQMKQYRLPFYERLHDKLRRRASGSKLSTVIRPRKKSKNATIATYPASTA